MSSSETEKPRIVVTISRSDSPAGPTSLFLTSASMAWLISCSSFWARAPKCTIEPLLPRSISALRRAISGLADWSAAGGTGGSGRTTEVTLWISSEAAAALAWV
jgi:hypothetical protein